MQPSRKLATLVCTALALALGACASAPKPLQGQFAALLPDQVTVAGERVRWGGSVIGVVPEAERTCFEVLGRELDAVARPRWNSDPLGRFLACSDRFYDPAIFEPGRDITFAGELVGFEEGKVGEYPYRYPVLRADIVYLWSERVPDHGYRWHTRAHFVPGIWGPRIIYW